MEKAKIRPIVIDYQNR